MRAAVLNLVTPILALVTACSESPTSETRVLTGIWGGANAELRAGGRSVEVRFACEWLRTEYPLVQVEQGRFLLPALPLGGRRGAHTATLRGTISGDTIRLEVVRVTLTGSTIENYTVVRGNPPNYGNRFCLTG